MTGDEVGLFEVPAFPTGVTHGELVHPTSPKLANVNTIPATTTFGLRHRRCVIGGRKSDDRGTAPSRTASSIFVTDADREPSRQAASLIAEVAEDNNSAIKLGAAGVPRMVLLNLVRFSRRRLTRAVNTYFRP